MKEFDKINIPYADCFVHEHQVNKRVEKANKKFNQYYAEEVKVVYFEQSTDESCTQSIHLFIKMISY